METFESIALRDSGRGMPILQQELGEGNIEAAAKALHACPRGKLLIATGFYVKGAAETDGPPGAFCLAKTAAAMGFEPIILTDSFCMGLFEDENIPVIYASTESTDADFEKLLAELRPSALISCERCGRNVKGFYGNMRDISISAYTAPIDRIFELAAAKGLLTVGIGDGGNEIGMGKLKKAISEKLALTPCDVATEHLIVATTSNRGAYALCAAMLQQAGRQSELMQPEMLGNFIAKIVAKGCVDGLSGIAEYKVDGFPAQAELDILSSLHELTAGRQ